MQEWQWNGWRIVTDSRKLKSRLIWSCVISIRKCTKDKIETIENWLKKTQKTVNLSEKISFLIMNSKNCWLSLEWKTFSKIWCRPKKRGKNWLPRQSKTRETIGDPTGFATRQAQKLGKKLKRWTSRMKTTYDFLSFYVEVDYFMNKK